ncbi:MAG: hypothetical protein RRB13_06735 [bacterium]|nr:hypothetical protein [bacterium]
MKYFVLLFSLSLWLPASLQAASCCGGGSAGALILPKGGPQMVDVSVAREVYDGYWDGAGTYRPDPANSSLSQNRISAGYGYRFAGRWQGSVVGSYVDNNNRYSGITSRTQGLGDTSVNLLYETFDEVTCVTEVRDISDLRPAIYFGLGLTVPTGISPYDDVRNSFDITGRGFYRADATVNIEKSIGGFNAGVNFGYGKHFTRPVNREYGSWVKPYDKVLGDRQTQGLSLGYSWQLYSFDIFTLTGAMADMVEAAARINGVPTEGTEVSKRSFSLTGAWSTGEKDWIVKGSWNNSLSGTNFPKTQTLSFSLSHVFF